MLRSLAIRDIAVVDRLDLAFEPGLTVLTGETGAGKSILLDALGLALGARAEPMLVRPGAESASVAAAFELAEGHAAHGLLAEHGLSAADDGLLVLRRVLGRDGRSRAFVNDQPATVALLRAFGSVLVEIEGQFAEQGLLDPRNHRAILDSFAGLEPQARAVRGAFRAFSAARRALADAEAGAARLSAEKARLEEIVREIAALDPRPGEEAALADERTVLMHREQVLEALNHAAAALGQGVGGRGAAEALRLAWRALDHVRAKAGGRFDEPLAALDRAAIELAEAERALHAVGSALDHDAGRLESVEERLFALRAAARRNAVAVDELPALRARLEDDLARLEAGADLARLRAEADAAEAAFAAAAQALSEGRARAAAALERAVAGELAPLRLGHAAFAVRLSPLPRESWDENGAERAAFEVATIKGASPGPIEKIASGGELARFLLALKVAAAGTGAAGTLVFDEVDRGIGGAAAAAVGERLSRLGRALQVLVVTHSPQVAAKGRHHFRVAKRGAPAAAILVEPLDEAGRREEIARMLSGERVTDEARAAAGSLLKGRALAPERA